MQENTNKAIAINTVILYVRLAVTVVCSLLITRFALRALGVDDFGLFSVVGSIITFVSIINTMMVATTNRFIAVALGHNDINEANQVFNVSLIIHLCIAVLTILIALPVGEWYINHFINYYGPISNAILVYRVVIIGSIISFISVPFYGLLTAKENFLVYCSVDIISYLFKLLAAVLLVYCIKQKLLFYAITQSFFTAIPTIIYGLYCKRKYIQVTKWHFIKEKKPYLEMLKFGGWVGFGAIATVGKAQAAQLLVNAFFNTIMNAALGVANTINHFITVFANNATEPMTPQLIKSYAASDMKRCFRLLNLSTKLSFLIMLLISSPFLLEMEWILGLWLGSAPEFASIFAKLLIIDAIVLSFNSGISKVIFANGSIAFYQLTINSLNLLSILFAYIILKLGYPAYSLFIVYICFTFIKLFFNQWALNRIGIKCFNSLLKGSYLPSLLVLALYLPVLMIHINLHPLLHIVIVFIYLSFLIVTVGLRRDERHALYASVVSIINKFKK